MADWKDALSKLAPGAAMLLGGPFAGLAVSFIGQALGLSAPTVQTIQQTLTNAQLSGDQIVALKKAELDLQAHLQDNGIELDKIAADDRASARGREVAAKDWMPKVLALIMVFAGCLLAAAIVMDWSPAIKNPTAAVTVGTVIGYVFNEIKQIFSYYFGNSAASARQTEIIAQSSPVSP